MTEDHKKQMKILCYANWLLADKYNTDHGLRDIETLKTVVELPGGGSLTCLTGERLANRKDLYTQIGWFIYYMTEGEPFYSKNQTLVLMMVLWCLKHYDLTFNAREVKDYLLNLDPMKEGNSDISIWFSNHCS